MSVDLIGTCSIAILKWENRYDDKVERYLDVFLRTPGIKTEDVTKAQLARGNARRLAAERLLAKAHQGSTFCGKDLYTVYLRPFRLPSCSETRPI